MKCKRSLVKFIDNTRGKQNIAPYIWAGSVYVAEVAGVVPTFSAWRATSIRRRREIQETSRGEYVGTYFSVYIHMIVMY